LRIEGWRITHHSGSPAFAGFFVFRCFTLLLRATRLGVSRQEASMEARPDNYKDLKLKLDGIVPSGNGFHRNLLFDAFYSSPPRDPQVKVQIYNAEIVPGGYTNWHCHNGAAFFVALQGLFEAHFQEGVLVRAKAGECYSEPIAKFHRGHNPHPDLPYLCIGVCFTSPDREHVTNSVARPW
jgi:quercetin dioxygenase-like cupin family protein